jgi:hypothetical protein
MELVKAMTSTSKMIRMITAIIGGLIAALGAFICGYVPVVPFIVIGVLIAIAGGTVAFLSTKLDDLKAIGMIVAFDGGLLAGIGGVLVGILILDAGVVIGILLAICGGLLAFLGRLIIRKAQGK